MPKLPDLEGLAIFAKIAELRSFALAAKDLELSKATVSKAVARLEKRLGARLFNRTSRRLALTDAGQRLLDRAARILAEGEAAESEAHAAVGHPARARASCRAHVLRPQRGGADLAGVPCRAYPEVSVDLHLSDELVDLIGAGFDAALRIAALPDSSLRARRLRDVGRYLVAAPTYLERHGRPTHPSDLMHHACLCYAYLPTPDVWRFFNKAGQEAQLRPAGPLRANNADALAPALLAGLGLAVQPDFVVGEAIKDGRLELVMPDWSPPPIALHLVMPPGGPRPARVEALASFLTERLGSLRRWGASGELISRRVAEDT